jgi:hypothetical protein
VGNKMHILYYPFFIQKKGNEEIEYEDSFFPNDRSSIELISSQRFRGKTIILNQESYLIARYNGLRNMESKKVLFLHY